VVTGTPRFQPGLPPRPHPQPGKLKTTSQRPRPQARPHPPNCGSASARPAALSPALPEPAAQRPRPRPREAPPLLRRCVRATRLKPLPGLGGRVGGWRGCGAGARAAPSRARTSTLPFCSVPARPQVCGDVAAGESEAEIRGAWDAREGRCGAPGRCAQGGAGAREPPS
jgi:hypothetical protein